MISNFSNIYRQYIVNEINVDEDDIVGLVERIYVDGIGEVDAKIDSGNGAYNVIHGDVIRKRGNNIIVKTVNGIKLKKKVVDEVVIHIGSGNKEVRPVVNFDIKLGDEEYKDVPFSIADRSENEYGILVGKQFLSKIDKLIDVDKEFEQD
tara:strand:- start:584 stop:1033 length:450 start_codon:yes stop_codon:yes gene_type:complete